MNKCIARNLYTYITRFAHTGTSELAPNKQKMSVYDLCIIGAGLFGSAAARHASADPSRKICLIGLNEPTKAERPQREIFSCHYDEGRITRILDENPVEEILSRNSIERYREIEELSGIHFYSPVGHLCVGPKNSPFMEKRKQIAAICKVPVVDLSYHGIFQKRYPYIELKKDEYGILDDTGAGYISARNLVAAQKKVAQKQGCCFIPGMVKEVKTYEGDYHKIVTDFNVEIWSKRILFCTGAFTNLKDFKPLPKLKIELEKQTVALLKISEEEAKRISSLPSMIYRGKDAEMGTYILPAIQYPDNNYYLKIGHSGEAETVKTLKEIKEWYLSEGDPYKIRYLSEVLKGLLPGLKVEGVSSMTCVTTKTPNGLPYIDRVSPTVNVAVAGNNAGAKFSDEVGRIAATLSLTGKWDSEIDKSTFKIIVDDQSC